MHKQTFCLQSDLIPQGQAIWARLPGYQPRGLERAMLDAFEDETAPGLPTEYTAQRMNQLGRQIAERLRESD